MARFDAEDTTVVYVIQKSNKYGLKQEEREAAKAENRCVCHSKK